MNHTEALVRESIEIRNGIDRAFTQPTPELRQQELDKTLEKAIRLSQLIREVKCNV